MASQYTTTELTEILLQASDRQVVICSEAQKDEWMEEYARHLDSSNRCNELLDGNPLYFGMYPEDLKVMDGQDFRGVDPAVLQGLDEEDTITECIFVGCNFAGMDLSQTVLEECGFEDCDLTDTVL